MAWGAGQADVDRGSSRRAILGSAVPLTVDLDACLARRLLSVNVARTMSGAASNQPDTAAESGSRIRNTTPPPAPRLRLVDERPFGGVCLLTKRGLTSQRTVPLQRYAVRLSGPAAGRLWPSLDCFSGGFEEALSKERVAMKESGRGDQGRSRCGAGSRLACGLLIAAVIGAVGG